MKSSVLLHFQWITLTCIGLLIFFGIYVGAIFRVYSAKNRQMYRAIETLPLDEGDSHV